MPDEQEMLGRYDDRVDAPGVGPDEADRSEEGAHA
jgi:hypothetical protein